MTRHTASKRLFEAFHDDDISYCHWKSNEHLREGIEGKTDLDILVKPDRKVETTLNNAGFRRFRPTGWAHSPGTDDYLGFDDETGKLVHLHLHYHIVLGEKRYKSYRLPWSERILSERVFDREEEVYRVEPNTELILLLVRYALKIRYRDYLSRSSYLGDSEKDEYEWLLERTTREGVTEQAKELLNEDVADRIDGILASGGSPTLRDFRGLKKKITDELSIYRSYGPVETKARGFSREALLGLRMLNNSYIRLPRLYRRTVPTGGVMIAVVGPDGSGKSTVVEDLSEWLSWKLDVQKVYFGSGEGAVSLLRYPISVVRKRSGDSGGDTPSEDGGKSRSFYMRAGRVLRALAISREKRKRLTRAWRARNRGMVVVGDRYPQAQVTGFNDGPLLDNLRGSTSRLKRFLGEREREVYELAQRNPPDLIIKLDVEPSTAASRTDSSEKEVRRKAEAVESLEFESETVTIDANRPLEDVLLDVRREVWKRI